ncbi:MAG: caspase family protein [Rubrivivax sp.]|nr:caspase family protein [Rubrivivax sp.]
MAKSALCIGINNYPGTDLDLGGCVNDAHDWAALLGGRGFRVTSLLDAAATKAAMAEGMRRLIGEAAKGDLVVITFSGHGTFVPDTSGDEPDRQDEGLCPYDIQQGGGALIDDEIHRLFAARKPGVKLVLISDSCHSGTVTRALGGEQPADLPRPRFMPYANWAPQGRAAAPAATAARGGARATARGRPPFKPALAAHEGDLLLSGCEEGPNKFSYDTRFKGRANGAFTYHALKTLREVEAANPQATYTDWHRAIAKALPTASLPQRPQIVGSDAAKNARIFG